MGVIEAIGVILAGLASIAGVILKFKDKNDAIEEERAKSAFKDRLLVAMKREVQNQPILYKKLEEISKCQNSADLSRLYNDSLRS